MSEEYNYWQHSMRRRVSRRTLLRNGALIGAGLAAGSSIFGCQSKPKAAVSTPIPGEQPEYGGVLAWHTQGDPPDFDILKQITYMTLHPIAPAYNGLVKYDPLDPNRVIGDLAEKWEVSSDGKLYTFHLIKGVRFHDSKPCTSADVKYTYDIVRDPPKGVVSARKNTLAAVDGIETPDENTVRFVLKQPAPSLLLNLAQGWMPVLPKHILQEKGTMAKDVIGTGPFKFKEYVRGNYVELVKNPDYHVKGRPYLDGFKTYIIPNPSTSQAYLRSGQLDYVYGMSGHEAEQLTKDAGGKVVVQEALSYSHNVLYFNSERKPWDDPRVREAVSLAIDRDESVKVARLGDGAVGGIMPPNGMWAMPPAALEKIPGYGKDKAANLARAKKLMAEAGHSNGFSTTLMARQVSAGEALNVFVKDQLTKLQIESKIDVQETASAYDTLAKRNYDLVPWGSSHSADDPDQIFGQFYLCNSDQNYSGFCIKEVEDLYGKQSQTLDIETRKKLVNEMEKAALLTQGRIVLDYATRFLGFSWRVRNYVMHPSFYNNQKHQDVWLAKK